jgi:hypothetical protein
MAVVLLLAQARPLFAERKHNKAKFTRKTIPHGVSSLYTREPFLFVNLMILCLQGRFFYIVEKLFIWYNKI